MNTGHWPCCSGEHSRQPGQRTVEGELSAKLADAETRIAATKTKALSSVNEIAAETASAVVSKLLGEDVSPAEIKKVLQPAAE